MNRCEIGYLINEDGTPPDRCHNDRKSEISSCKQCPAYNHEPDLIEQAIESARCRIYRLKHNCGKTKSHQVKAKNQQELMKITIKALEFYREYID
ncbi:hypothetical protein [Lacrimispora sp.]|uniref:hypothetical protein n=1 Tax=Lacrimispora sp. TaxID=2719234 RepID=UPI00346165AD